ncbi:MAG TPA: carbohydrate-binding protein [Verrucomicrobiae bacterium]|nr:carbohydrate-binding protein [Verrucomicrobiae bacterium]
MKHTSRFRCAWVGATALVLVLASNGALPPGYQGKPFRDSVYGAGAQVIPGRIECAYYDLGGEGVAYHDTDATNHGSGELNLKPQHQRPHSNSYVWGFRSEEGVDISYTKDFADFNHTNFVAPATNQLYIGWTDNGEWCNYTVNVKKAGTYKIVALYGNAANRITFSINHQPVSECQLPLATGSMHIWNKAQIGTITFSEAGLQLLTFHYNKGNNFAYFDFEPVAANK